MKNIKKAGGIMEKVAIIGPIDYVGKETIRKNLNGFDFVEIATEAEYNEKLKDVDYVVLRTLTLREAALKNARKLKYIQRWGAGYDSVDIKVAGEQGIPVGVLPGVNSTPVAEYAVLLTLATMRHLTITDANVRSGKGRDEKLLSQAYIIQGKTVGILGMGKIGQKVTKLLQAFGANVIYYDAFRLSAEKEKELNIKYVEIEEIASVSDIISIHVPLLDSTRHIINKKFLQAMKPNAVIINTSRGGIIDENDLFDALKDHKILGAGIDVFEKEPITKDNVLLTLDNIIASAHCAGNTIDNSVMMGKYCAENILKVSKGEKLHKPTLVNEEYLSK